MAANFFYLGEIYITTMMNPKRKIWVLHTIWNVDLFRDFKTSSHMFGRCLSLSSTCSATQPLSQGWSEMILMAWLHRMGNFLFCFMNIILSPSILLLSLVEPQSRYVEYAWGLARRSLRSRKYPLSSGPISTSMCHWDLQLSCKGIWRTSVKVHNLATI